MATILVIDDEKSIRNTLKDILGMEKYKVEEAENGEIALEKSGRRLLMLFFVILKCPAWMELKYWIKRFKLQILLLL